MEKNADIEYIHAGNERKGNRKRDLSGQRFGKLVALTPTDQRIDNGSVVWHCQCDCGNTADVSARRLVRGKACSCGCLSNPPPKNYIGQVFGRLTVIGYAGKKRKKTERSAVTITYWLCRCTCGKEIVAAQPGLQNGDTESCGCLQKDRVREALKLVDGTSAAILERNQKLRSSNTSGCTGVTHDKRTGKWVAYINFKKKRYWLGRYANKKDAISARKTAEEIHENFLDWYYRTYS
ncbi:AP2/ERF family transcription factor [Hominifimenecus sp. rT4P-3]|uniref:AP2/ERF family transcription factor n=1 Tax=Hominifimenecus sp. rT4P-3 TaxID=3242979 RepID=UPI003DA25C34